MANYNMSIYIATNIETGKSIMGNADYLSEMLNVAKRTVYGSVYRECIVGGQWRIEKIGCEKVEVVREEKKNPPKKNKQSDLIRIAVAARQAGMTYGEYVAKMGL